jgi:hypothetical protein
MVRQYHAEPYMLQYARTKTAAAVADFDRLLEAGNVLNAAYSAKLGADLPIILDLAKDLVKYRNTVIRYPLGMLRFSNAKLIATGFRFPTGVKLALEQAIAKQLRQRDV